MFYEYYGPTAEAEYAINQIMNLPATGKEQDWEIELSDPERIDEMLDILENKILDLENQSALSLLLIGSMEEAGKSGMLHNRQIQRAFKFFQENNKVRGRMCFYWLALGQGDDVDLLKRILAC